MEIVTKIVPTRNVHNFGYRNPFSMIFAPLESPDCQLSIGTRIMKNGFLYRKLWTNRTRTILDPGISVFSCNFLEINSFFPKIRKFPWYDGLIPMVRWPKFHGTMIVPIVPIVPKKKCHVQNPQEAHLGESV